MSARRSGEATLREACKRSSTSGHRRHTATIQPYHQTAAETTPSGAVPVSFFCIYPLPYHRDFDPQLVLMLVSTTEPFVSSSFRWCTAAYNECTPSRALRFSFLFPCSSFLLWPHLRRCPLIFFYFFPRHLPSCSLAWSSLLSFSSPLFPTLYHGNKWGAQHTSKQEKRRRLSCCKLKRTGAGLPCFSTAVLLTI